MTKPSRSKWTAPNASAAWVAPCPIRGTELRAGAQRRRRTNERMADRTRRRQPLLPLLVEYVDAKRQHLAELLAAASAADRDQVLTVGSGVYRRLFTPWRPVTGSAARPGQRPHP